MTIKKSIGWTDMTLNPIKGRCLGGCWYCWTKPLYKRKFLQAELNLNLDVFFKLPKSSRKIFLCSTHDLFGDWISKKWRDDIFANIQLNSQHTFQILTKYPENIDREMPDNVWLGVSITGLPNEEQFNKGFDLFQQEAKIKFISFEPLLYPINESLVDNLCGFDWIIIGQLTGFGKKHNPQKYWIGEIIESAKKSNIPIFMKDNLKPIWGENLIQEFPDV